MSGGELRLEGIQGVAIIARKKSIKFMILMLFSAIVGMGAYSVSVMSRPVSPLDPSSLARVERGDVARSVVAIGSIEPISKIEIKSKPAQMKHFQGQAVLANSSSRTYPPGGRRSRHHRSPQVRRHCSNRPPRQIRTVAFRPSCFHSSCTRPGTCWLEQFSRIGFHNRYRYIQTKALVVAPFCRRVVDPVRDENVCIPRVARKAVRSPDQLCPVGAEHREAIKSFVEG